MSTRWRRAWDCAKAAARTSATSSSHACWPAKCRANHYARPEETQYYTLHRLRLALATASLLMVLGSGGWSGINFIEGVNFKQQALDATQKARFYGQRYELARAKLPPTPVEPEQIKTAVDAVATLRQYKPDPSRSCSARWAACWNARPMVTLDELAWTAAADAASRGDGHRRASRRARAVWRRATGSITRWRNSAHTSKPFDGDFRKAIAVVDSLADELKAQPDKVHGVTVLQYPLDTRPEASVSGTCASSAGEPVVPAFRIKLVLEVRDGQRVDWTILRGTAGGVRAGARGVGGDGHRQLLLSARTWSANTRRTTPSFARRAASTSRSTTRNASSPSSFPSSDASTSTACWAASGACRGWRLCAAPATTSVCSRSPTSSTRSAKQNPTSASSSVTTVSMPAP
jgi:hypothetical protein